MEKLRKDFLKERMMMKSIVFEKRPPTVARPLPPQTVPPPKMVIDPHKLEETIKKACIPVVRRSIQILDKLPDKPPEERKPVVVVAVCKAMNLNGTPCKCRAKIGKFCAKHAP
jgi:hypothetical protein